MSFRQIRNYKHIDVYSFIVCMFFIKLLFDSFVTFSFALISVGLWGLYNQLNFYVANVVYVYEKVKKEKTDSAQRGYKPLSTESSQSNGLKINKGFRTNGLFKKNGAPKAV